MDFLRHFSTLFLESAPWLLLGFILAGMLKVFVPMGWMNKQLGGHGLKSVVKAAIFGAPLPLCSCGVIPAAVGLRRAGASKAATTSFLVSTPETGIDSITVSYVLLGPFMAIVRPIAAIGSAIFAGLLVGKDEKEIKTTASYAPETSSCCGSATKEPEASSCCGSATKEPEATSCCGSAAKVPETSCCGSSQAPTKTTSVVSKIRSGLVYAGTELVEDTALWLLVGLAFAALVQTYIPDGFLASWGNGLLAMLVMVVISIPMYICATASTPIAAGLLLAGVAPGAVLVFMMAGPATNIATLGVVAKELGKKALIGYLTGVLGGALFFGFLVDFLVTKFHISVVPQIGPDLTLLPSWVSLSTGVLLALLIVVSITKQLTAKLSNKHSHQHNH